MTFLRIVLRGLAVLNLLLAGFTALVGSFADGNDMAARLLLTVLHPVTALAILVLVFAPRLTKPFMVGIAAVIAFSVAADIYYAVMIALGNVKGDWPLPLVFAIIPTIALVYAIKRTREPAASADDGEGANE